MPRVPKKFKAQLITADKDGNQIKRNFNNVRADITDDQLNGLSVAVQHVLAGENLKSMSLTANSSLKLY